MVGKFNTCRERKIFPFRQTGRGWWRSSARGRAEVLRQSLEHLCLAALRGGGDESGNGSMLLQHPILFCGDSHTVFQEMAGACGAAIGAHRTAPNRSRA